MSKLNGSKTHQNLKDAFAGESQANRRYLYFAQVADIEGLPEIYRNVVLLRDIEEMDIRETAAVLHISEASVKVRLHRARALLSPSSDGD